MIALKKIRKIWSGIEDLKPSQTSPAAVQEWATRFKGEGTSYAPAGARRVIKATDTGEAGTPRQLAPCASGATLNRVRSPIEMMLSRSCMKLR